MPRGRAGTPLDPMSLLEENDGGCQTDVILLSPPVDGYGPLKSRAYNGLLQDRVP